MLQLAFIIPHYVFEMHPCWSMCPFILQLVFFLLFGTRPNCGRQKADRSDSFSGRRYEIIWSQLYSLFTLSSPYSPSLFSSPALLRILNIKRNSKRRPSLKGGSEFSTLPSRKEQTFSHFSGAANIYQILAECKNLD